MGDPYPLRWAKVFSVRLTYTTGHEGAWHRFRSCLKDPRCLVPLQEALPAGLLSELLAAADSPQADRAAMRRLASLLSEWVQSESASTRVETRPLDS